MVKTLYIVIPCYNEEDVLNETIKVMEKKINELIKKKMISHKSRVLFVDDGSSDKTWSIIQKVARKKVLFTGISLSRNRGHQNALVAGLMIAKDYADMVISIDADLQDDVEVIDLMIKKYLDGCQIVYGVRNSRKKDTFFKKFTAELFYKIMLKMGVDIIYNHADYRLTSKKILEEFANFREVNLFLRGVFPLIGFKSGIVYYERGKRYAGKSKYQMKKMIALAWDGITSFSVYPIKIIVYIGLFQSIISFILMIIFGTLNIMKYNALKMESVIFLIIFLAGMQTLFIGLIGEYIGKIYFETKKRPRYIIEKRIMDDDKR